MTTIASKEADRLCAVAENLHARGYAHGSTGNISVRVGDRILVTPTGKSLHGLTPEDLAEVDLAGTPLGANRPSKEAPFHLAVYRQRPEARAVVHLHAPYSVALSCLANLDPARPVPALTPYYFMRVAPLGIVPYHRPGSPGLAAAIDAAAACHHCLLLRNHGSVCSGGALSEAADRAEELEATARLHFMLRNEAVQTLTAAEIEDLARTFAS